MSKSLLTFVVPVFNSETRKFHGILFPEVKDVTETMGTDNLEIQNRLWYAYYQGGLMKSRENLKKGKLSFKGFNLAKPSEYKSSMLKDLNEAAIKSIEKLGFVSKQLVANLGNMKEMIELQAKLQQVKAKYSKPKKDAKKEVKKETSKK